MRLSKLAMVASVALLVGSARTASAAAITWQFGPNFGGPTGYLAIDTTGTLVEAVNNASVADGPLTVDPSGLNITFTAVDSKLNQGTFGSGSPGSTDAAWNSIINSSDYNNSNAAIPGFFTGLSVGQQYQVQLFASDTRAGVSGRVQSFHDGLGNNSPTFVQGSLTSIIGTFTADATTQTLGLTASSNNPVLGAYVLRAVPEPTSLGLLSIAGVGLIRRRRR